MFGDRKAKKDDEPMTEQPAAPGEMQDTPPTGDDVNLEGESPVTPPPVPPTKAQSVSGAGGGLHGKNLTILLVASIALLVVALIVSSIALAFAIGDHGGVRRSVGPMMRGNMGNMNRPGAGQFRQQLKDLAGGGEVSIIRGKVTTVAGGNVTIETPSGNETVVVTDSTRFRGAGLNGGQGGASSLTTGEQVTVFAKKTADGKLEAIMVSAAVVNAPNK